MKQIFLNVLKAITSPLIGQGFIDKYFPFLISLYEVVYYYLQPSGLKEVSLTLDLKMKVPYKDTHVGMYLINSGVFEPLETSEILKVVKDKFVIFDIGANFGYYTLLLSKKFPDNKVYSFEPDKDNKVLLSENISLNNLNNIKIEELALSDKSGSVSFVSSKIHRGKSQISSGKQYSYKVSMNTLDNYCVENKISEINLIKLDVEGSEIPILRGGKDIISRSKDITLFIEYNPRSYTEFGFTKEDFFNTLHSVNLVPISILDERSNKVLSFSEDTLTNVLSSSTYTNLICKKV